MGELIELIIRLIDALSGESKKKKRAPPDPKWVAQQAEWERRRREWEAAQQQQQPPLIAATSQRGGKRGRAASGFGQQVRSAPPPAKPAVHSLMADLADTTDRMETPTA